MNSNEIESELQIKAIQIDKELSSVIQKWKEYNTHINNGFIYHDPDYLKEFFKDKKKDLKIFFFDSKGAFGGVAPFQIVNWPLKCQIGEVTFAKIPLRRFRLLGGYLTFPNNYAAHDALFNKIISLRNEFDAIYLESLNVDSFFWKYLSSSSLISSNFIVYTPYEPKQHPLIQMEGSFEEYMNKFSTKTRYKRLREVKKLREQGDISLMRITAPEDVEAFSKESAEVSRKTYQYNLLGLGIRNEDLLKRNLRFLAERGWLRSYLLKCNGVACSFMIGYQDVNRFYYIDIGYDAKWMKFSAGNVLQLLVLEDLYQYRTPRIFDFGSYGKHKKFFSNDHYMETDVYLFPRRVYSHFARSVHSVSLNASDSVAKVLDRFGLKNKIKKAIRKFSVARTK
jgi:hypothetical protein